MVESSAFFVITTTFHFVIFEKNVKNCDHNHLYIFLSCSLSLSLCTSFLAKSEIKGAALAHQTFQWKVMWVCLKNIGNTHKQPSSYGKIMF